VGVVVNMGVYPLLVIEDYFLRVSLYIVHFLVIGK
jgi:hypothetical protein